MGFYESIWLASATLAGLSLLLMVVLVVRRVFSDRTQRRHKAHRDEMLTRLLDHLADGQLDDASQIVADNKDVAVLWEVIEHLLRSLSGEERDRLIEVLRSLGGVEERLEILFHGEEWERAAAAASLRHFEEARVVAGLRLALEDRSPKVRSAAARALLELGRIHSAGHIVEKLVVEADLPPQALRDLFRKLAGDFRDDLIEVLRSGAEPARLVAIDALGHSGDLSVVEPLLTMVGGRSKEITASVFRALALLGDPRALPAVMQGLEDPAWEIRCQAALCAGQIRAIEARDLLARLLDDPVWWVRYRSAEALYELGEQGISILRRLGTKPSRAGEAAQLVLAEKAVAA